MTTRLFGEQGGPEVVPGDGAGRYGELIYTSFDNGSGSGGGWQLKDQIGNLTAADIDAMTERIVTKFDVGTPLPQYPTSAAIENRPARLAYDVLSDGAGIHWHTVDAGLDGSGRPGNVFAHVVLDDDFDARPALRPIEMWGSADWLRPYNAQQVRATTLSGRQAVQAGGLITVRTALDFLLETYREGVFQVLLDAVYDAMTGGRPVVLLAETAEAAQWIGAVSYFMSPGTARRFSWATHDKPDLALADARRGMNLICVPRDGTELPAADWIVIDAEEEDPPLGALGGKGHAPSRSSFSVPVSPWSLIAQAALVDVDRAMRVIALQDDIAREVGDRGLSPVWPIAVASRLLGLGDVDRESAHAVTDDHPSHLGSSERLHDLVEDLYRVDAPTTPDEAIRRLIRIRYTGGSQARAALQLVRCALVSEHWLNAPDTVIDSVPVCRAVDFGRVREPFAAWLTATQVRLAEPVPPFAETVVLSALRVGELLHRVVGPGPDLDAAMDALSDAVEISGVEFLRAPSRAVAFAGATAGISGATMSLVLQRVVATAIQAPHELDLEVWRWLFGDSGIAPALGATGSITFDQHVCELFPLYIGALLDSSAAETVAPRRKAELAHIAVECVMALRGYSVAERYERVARLTEHHALTTTQLTDFIDRYQLNVLPAMAWRCVLYAPASRELDRVLDFVCNYPLRQPDPLDEESTLVVAVARVRSAAAWTDFKPSWALKLMDTEVPLLVSGLHAEVFDHADEDLCVPMAALYIAGQSQGRRWAAADSSSIDCLATRLRSFQPELIDWIDRLVERGIIDIAWIAGESASAHMVFGMSPIALCARDATGEPPDTWMDLLIDTQLANDTYRGPATVEALRDALWDSVRGLTATEAESFFLEYRTSGKTWLRERGLLARESSRPRFSLTNREDHT